MELREVALIALRGIRNRLIDAARLQRLEIVAHALEPTRQRLPRLDAARGRNAGCAVTRLGAPLRLSKNQMAAHLDGSRRQLRGELALTAGLDSAPGRVERRGQDDVRVAVGRVAPQRPAPPLDPSLRIPLDRA